MSKLYTFPIITTDNKATELTEGLCPPLASSVSLSGNTTIVNSEYGIRSAINNYCETIVSGKSLGGGTSILREYMFDDIDKRGELTLKTISQINTTRFTLSELSGNLNISYNGYASTNYIVSGLYVQGGSNQLLQTIGGKTDFPYSNLVGTNLYMVSGTCTTNIPISAHMETSSLTGNVALSADAIYNWNTDISVGKILVRIPLENAFPYSDQIIWLGNDSNPTYYGYFKTRTTTDILSAGEWVDFNYSSSMYTKQFDYITSPNHIKMYTTGVIVNGTPPGGLVSGTVGLCDVIVFYDKPSYGGDVIESVSLDSSINNQSTPITKVFPSRGIAQIKYKNGNYDTQYDNDITLFNASASSIEYYGDKDNWINISGTVGTSVGIYIKSTTPSGNSGILNLEYNFKGL